MNKKINDDAFGLTSYKHKETICVKKKRKTTLLHWKYVFDTSKLILEDYIEKL